MALPAVSIDSDELDLALPPIAVELAETIGLKQMFELVDRAGGMKVKVPKVPSDDCTLVRHVGLPLFIKLVEHYGGSELQIPTLRNLHAKKRQALVLEKVVAGDITVNEAAVRLRVTARWIYNLLARIKNEDQPSLFD